MEEILTAEQVAQILQVHPFTVLKFIKQGKLKASKLGRVYRIRKSDVDSFLDDQIEQTQKNGINKPEKAKKTRRKKVSKKKEIAKKEEVVQEIKEGKKEEAVTKEKDVVSEKKSESVEPRRDTNDIDHYVLELKPR
jgi:excisionase family DNA binding protein